MLKKEINKKEDGSEGIGDKKRVYFYAVNNMMIFVS